VVLPERQATICLPRAAQTMRARPIPSTGYQQFASQAVEKTATSLVSSACEPKPVSTARERYSPDRALTPVQKASGQAIHCNFAHISCKTARWQRGYTVRAANDSGMSRCIHSRHFGTTFAVVHDGPEIRNRRELQYVPQ
jgi:hypothetical protein